MKNIFCLGMIGILSISTMTLPIGKKFFSEKAKDYTVSANANVKSVRVLQKEIENSEGNILLDLKIPIIKGLEDKKIQNDINSKIYNDIMNFKKEVEKKAQSTQQETQDTKWEYVKYTANTKYEVTYNDNGIISIQIIYYEYTGGAHGLTNIKTFNINLRTGKIITLGDLFKSEANYKDIITKEILRQMNLEPEKYFPSAISKFEPISEEQPFYIEKDNIVVYFELYELAPYVSGIPEFKIPFSLFNNGIKDGLLD